jgi:hypothetical protein
LQCAKATPACRRPSTRTNSAPRLLGSGAGCQLVPHPGAGPTATRHALPEAAFVRLPFLPLPSSFFRLVQQLTLALLQLFQLALDARGGRGSGRCASEEAAREIAHTITNRRTAYRSPRDEAPRQTWAETGPSTALNSAANSQATEAGMNNTHPCTAKCVRQEVAPFPLSRRSADPCLIAPYLKIDFPVGSASRSLR